MDAIGLSSQPEPPTLSDISITIDSEFLIKKQYFLLYTFNHCVIIYKQISPIEYTNVFFLIFIQIVLGLVCTLSKSISNHPTSLFSPNLTRFNSIYIKFNCFLGLYIFITETK